VYQLEMEISANDLESGIGRTVAEPGMYVCDRHHKVGPGF
jgi:hypothetical protein